MADAEYDYAVTHVVSNVNNVTSSMVSSLSFEFQESGGGSSGLGRGLGGPGGLSGPRGLGGHGGLGALGELAGLVDIKPAAVADLEYEVRAHQGAPRASRAQAAAADRELVFPVCEAEPSACSDACLYRTELVMARCMAWLHVSDASAGSGAPQRSANIKAGRCRFNSIATPV